MKRNTLVFELLVGMLTCLLLNASMGGDKPSNQSTDAGIGSYKTQKIDRGFEYTVKYNMPAKGDPVEMVYEFFEQNKSFVSIKNPRKELIPTYKAMDSLGGVVSFQQLYNGVPILHSNITARFTGSGELRKVEGDYHFDINLSTTPTIDSASAVRNALADLGSYPKARVEGPKGLSIVSSRSFYGHGPDNLYLVWTLRIFPNDRKNSLFHWGYYINALDGSIVHKQSDEGAIR